MSYAQEQITKTFEHLLRLYQYYNTADSSFVGTRKSRTLYRINQEKLKNYHDNQRRLSNENSKLYLEGKQAIILPEKILDRKTTSTQTVFDKEITLPIDLFHQPVDPSSNATDIRHAYYPEGEAESINTLSSSSSSIKKTIATTISSPSSTELDFHNHSTSQTSTEMNCNQFEEYSSKPKSTNCRVYIRSIARHMFDDDITDEEQSLSHETFRNKQIKI